MRTTLLLLWCLLLAACQPVNDPLDEAQITTEVLNVLGEYADASENGDVERALSFFIDDDRFVWAEDGTIRYSTFEELEAAIRSLPSFGGVQTEYSDQTVHVASSDHASIMAKFSSTIGDPSAGGFSFSGVSTMNMIRTPEGWKIMSGHTSSYRPRPGYEAQ